MTFAGQGKCLEAVSQVGVDNGVNEVVPICRGSDEKRVLVLIGALLRDVKTAVVVFDLVFNCFG